MFRLDADRAVEFCDGLRRRDFLHAGSLSFLGLGLPQLFQLKAQGAVDNSKKDINCIMLFLVGGPSQLDTWDMKPNAPVEIRGPYKPIKTNVPGIEISENFPRMAKHADKYALIRSVYHTAAAVHDTGHQMMQTGRLFQGGIEYPHIGCVLSKLKGPNGDVPPHVLLPRPIGNTGGNMPHGQIGRIPGQDIRSVRAERRSVRSEFQGAGYAAAGLSFRAARRSPRATGARWSTRRSASSRPRRMRGCSTARFHQAYTLMSSQKAREAFELHKEPEKVREKYGLNRFGQSCLLARRMIEAGVRFVTVNMFETVFDEITWDIHGSKPFSPISCYRDLVGPMFDMAYSSLLEDLQQRGHAGEHHGGGHGRVRPHAQGESGGRARPLAAMLDDFDGRRRIKGRAGRRRVRRYRCDPEGSTHHARRSRGDHLQSTRYFSRSGTAGRPGAAHPAGGTRDGADQRAVCIVVPLADVRTAPSSE